MESDSLFSENSLLQTDPQWRLRIALDKNDLITFKKLVNSAVVNLEYVYQYPDYKTCLELAICEVNKLDSKKKLLKQVLQLKGGGNETFTATYKIIKKINFVKFLLENNVEVNRVNKTYDAAPIHFAIENENIGALQALLDDDRIDLNVKSKGSTALLLAIQRIQNVDDDREHNYTLYRNMIEMLLKAGSNVNATGPNGITPVFIAAKEGNEEIIRIMLNYAHDPIDLDSYKHNDSGKTARQYLKESLPHLESKFKPKLTPATVDSSKISKLFSYLLSFDENNFVRDYRKLVEDQGIQSTYTDNNSTNTMLQLATEKGLEKAVEILLKSGVDPNATCTGNTELPVAIACRNGYNNILKLFIDIGTTIFKAVNGESLLQITIEGMKFSSKEPKANFSECLNTLLTSSNIEPPININHSDFKDNTALHYAIRNGDQNIVLQLLRKGACIGFRNKFNEPPLADINPITLENYFDECVTANSGRLSDNDYEIRFKYDFLLNPKSLKTSDKEHRPLLQENGSKANSSIISPEMQSLMYMTQNEQLWPLLKHPIITSFIYLKWRQISSLFIANLGIYFIFWLNLMWYIRLENLIEKDKKDYLQVLNIITYIVASIGLVLLSCREIFQMTFSTSSYYFGKSKNWLEILLILITGWFLFGSSTEQSTKNQLSAVAILLSSIELLLLIGHFPHFSTYIVMLKTVCKNFFKFILWYCILIIAFALSFYVLFKNIDNKEEQNPSNSTSSVEEDFFVDPGRSLFKTIVMLTGEFDTGSIKFKTYPVTSHVIFIIFVFMITIVLLNLLSGLAVSDTQEIRANAELVGIITTVQSISYVEKVFIRKLYTNSRIWNCLPSCLKNLNFFKPKTLCIMPFAKKITLFPDFLPLCSIVVKPNRDNSIEIPHPANHEDGDDCDVVETGKCCFNMWHSYRLDRQIVKNAKILLNKKSQSSELNEIKGKLSQILQILESR